MSTEAIVWLTGLCIGIFIVYRRVFPPRYDIVSVAVAEDVKIEDELRWPDLRVRAENVIPFAPARAATQSEASPTSPDPAPGATPAEPGPSSAVGADRVIVESAIDETVEPTTNVGPPPSAPRRGLLAGFFGRRAPREATAPLLLEPLSPTADAPAQTAPTEAAANAAAPAANLATSTDAPAQRGPTMIDFFKRLFGGRAAQETPVAVVPGAIGEAPSLDEVFPEPDADAPDEGTPTPPPAQESPPPTVAEEEQPQSTAATAPSAATTTPTEATSVTPPRILTDLERDEAAAISAAHLPSTDDLIAAAMPDLHAVKDFQGEVPQHILDNIAAADVAVPYGLSAEELAILDEERSRIAEEDAQSEAQAKLVAAEFEAAANQAQEYAQVVAEAAEETREAEEAAHADRVAGRWAAEFQDLGDDGYVEPPDRARLLEALPEFGDEGRVLLERIVSEDARFADRARELLASIAA